MQKRKILKSDLPHGVHAKVIDAYAKVSANLFAELQLQLVKDIKSKLKSDKLAKSDKLKSGWTGDVPKIKADIETKIAKTLDKYMQALRYFMLGDYAGKEAKEAAEALGFLTKIKPGASYGIYLQAIDTQRDYFKQIYLKQPPNIPVEVLKETFETIQKKTDRMVTESLDRYRNKLVDAIEMGIEEKNFENLAAVHEKAHELSDKGKSVASANKVAESKIDLTQLVEKIAEINEKAAEDWDRNTETVYNMSSSVGTHQAVAEIFGKDDDSVKAALLNMVDERCCDKCDEFARRADGSLRLYNLSDFKPAGYNYGRKLADWCLCIPGIHPRCRCTIIYIPPGAKISKDGIITF